ncbi:hypothetical protein HanRHA438_Chr14g0648501 [Helianthus annuus]|nr:hypothetical protein HanRHA438_Chr14g0648501 [Helianthus annuus]
MFFLLHVKEICLIKKNLYTSIYVRKEKKNRIRLGRKQEKKIYIYTLNRHNSPLLLHSF